MKFKIVEENRNYLLIKAIPIDTKEVEIILHFHNDELHKISKTELEHFGNEITQFVISENYSPVVGFELSSKNLFLVEIA